MTEHPNLRKDTYLGALSHGARTIVIQRDGRRIRWQTDRQQPHDGTPAQAHDAIEAWIVAATADWTEQAELRRRALNIRHRIDQKEHP